jgi:hypothetical protein
MALVFSGWRALVERPIEVAREGAFYILSGLRTSLNGAYEGLTGAPAPGRSWRAVMAHDHTESGGGAILPRGVVLCMDSGEGAGWEWQPPGIYLPMTDKTYFHDLQNDVPTRTPTFRLYTTDGIHSGKTNLAGNPCELEARATMYVEDRGGAGNSVDFKFRNVATGATSSTQTVTISALAKDTVTLVFGDLPLRNASGLQEYELLVGCGSSAITLRLQTLVIAETRESSQPESKGANLYNSSAATTRV